MLTELTQQQSTDICEIVKVVFGITVRPADQLRFMESGGTYWVASAQKLDGTGREFVAGFAAVRQCEESLEVLQVAVLPELRRKGIGSYLLQAAVDSTDKTVRLQHVLGFAPMQFFASNKFEFCGTGRRCDGRTIVYRRRKSRQVSERLKE